MSKKVFRSSRKSNPKIIRERANIFYRRQWDVGAIADVESIESEYPDSQDALNALHLFDYMGVDKIITVEDPHQIIPIAERFKNYESRGDRFSLRVNTGTEMPGEKEKYLNGYRQNGSHPAVYAFAKKWKDGEDFKYFHLVDFKEFLRLIDSGELERDRLWKNRRDGTEAELYKFEDMREAGCILNSWGEGWE